MRNKINKSNPAHLTSLSFLENVMPQIKINENRFKLSGIAPVKDLGQTSVTTDLNVSCS